MCSEIVQLWPIVFERNFEEEGTSLALSDFFALWGALGHGRVSSCSQMLLHTESGASGIEIFLWDVCRAGFVGRFIVEHRWALCGHCVLVLANGYFIYFLVAWMWANSEHALGLIKPPSKCSRRHFCCSTVNAGKHVIAASQKPLINEALD